MSPSDACPPTPVDDILVTRAHAPGLTTIGPSPVPLSVPPPQSRKPPAPSESGPRNVFTVRIKPPATHGDPYKVRADTAVTPDFRACGRDVLNLPGKWSDHCFHPDNSAASVVPPITAKEYTLHCAPTGLFDGERIRAAVAVRSIGDKNQTRTSRGNKSGLIGLAAEFSIKLRWMGETPLTFGARRSNITTLGYIVPPRAKMNGRDPSTLLGVLCDALPSVEPVVWPRLLHHLWRRRLTLSSHPSPEQVDRSVETENHTLLHPTETTT